MYNDLHTAILEDIARHIADTLKATSEAGLMPSAAYEVERLRAAGLLRGKIIRKLAEAADMSRKEIRRIFKDAAIKARWYDDIAYHAAELFPAPLLQSPAMRQILNAGINKTHGSVERLTGTIAINSEERFNQLLTLGYNKVTSGAFSYQEAIASTADDLAREGIKIFNYASGRKISVEAAVRMNILTGANQTAAKITEETMKELGVSLVRTSAHQGARMHTDGGFKSHVEWQGEVFYWKELDNSAKNGIIDVEAERAKILDGTYPSRVIQGRQNKHIPGTREFEQKREQMQKASPGSKPAILNTDAQALVDAYKGTGTLEFKGSKYPRETIDTNNVIGKTWVKSLGKYAETKRIEIFYSSTGVHTVPVSDYNKE